MKTRVLLKFTVRDDNPDNIFLEDSITKIVKISNIDTLEEQIKQRYPNFMHFNSITVLDHAIGIEEKAKLFLKEKSWINEIWKECDLEMIIDGFVKYCKDEKVLANGENL